MRSWEGELSPFDSSAAPTVSRPSQPDARVLELLSRTERSEDVGPPVERTEAGRMPPGRLEQAFVRMTALLREGRFDEVRSRLDDVVQRYPGDLLLVRQVAEFHIETGDKIGALSALFTLARRLFEQKSFEEMRRVLEKVLVLDPTSERAFRLLGLLDNRPETSP